MCMTCPGQVLGPHEAPGGLNTSVLFHSWPSSWIDGNALKCWVYWDSHKFLDKHNIFLEEFKGFSCRGSAGLAPGIRPSPWID